MMAADTKIYDLLVVGAGPGGSSAVSAALEAGLSVIQIEKQAFPRVKPCAGGLTVKAARSAGEGIRLGLHRSASSFEFSSSELCLRFDHIQTILRFVYRPEFDQRLVDANRRKPGFAFFDETELDQIEYDQLFTVRSSRGVIRARQLVAADGSYSMVNRTFRISRPRGWATALEVVLPRSRARLTGAMEPCLDFGAIDRGYGWIFPKQDHWSVGLYTLAAVSQGLRARLAAYLESKGYEVAGDPLARVDAHRYPVGGYRLTVPEVPVYLVGDAGGFAEAICGEGIYYALRSGRLAGEAAARACRGTGSYRQYYRRIWPSVLGDTFLSWYAARLFYRDPARWIRVLGNPLVWRPIVQGYSEGATIAECVLLGWKFLLGSFRRTLVSRQADRLNANCE